MILFLLCLLAPIVMSSMASSLSEHEYKIDCSNFERKSKEHDYWMTQIEIEIGSTFVKGKAEDLNENVHYEHLLKRMQNALEEEDVTHKVCSLKIKNECVFFGVLLAFEKMPFIYLMLSKSRIERIQTDYILSNERFLIDMMSRFCQKDYRYLIIDSVDPIENMKGFRLFHGTQPIYITSKKEKRDSKALSDIKKAHSDLSRQIYREGRTRTPTQNIDLFDKLRARDIQIKGYTRNTILSIKSPLQVEDDIFTFIDQYKVVLKMNLREMDYPWFNPSIDNLRVLEYQP